MELRTMRIAAVAAALALIPLVPATVLAAPADPVQLALDRVVQGGAAGVQIRVARDGRARTLTAGSAVRGVRQPVPADGRFRIGSITKTFTVTVVLQLVGEGRVELDAPVGRYLPGLLPAGDRITVRMLLQHTSGLYNYTDDVPTSGRDFLRSRFTHYSAEQIVGIATAHPLGFDPGSTWSYSNTNYVVAGMLIKAVTGHPWGAEVSQRILWPLGLHSTTVPGDSPFVPGPHARGYLPVDGSPADVTELNPSVADAAGALISTTADLDRFLTALTGGRLLKPAQYAQLTRTLPITGGYGLAFAKFTTSCGVPVWGHNGGIPGYLSVAVTTLDQTRRLEVSITTETGPARESVQALVNTAVCA